MNSLPGLPDLPPGVSMCDIDPPSRCIECLSPSVVYRDGERAWCADCVPADFCDGPNINEDEDDR